MRSRIKKNHPKLARRLFRGALLLVAAAAWLVLRDSVWQKVEPGSRRSNVCR